MNKEAMNKNAHVLVKEECASNIKHKGCGPAYHHFQLGNYSYDWLKKETL